MQLTTIIYTLISGIILYFILEKLGFLDNKPMVKPLKNLSYEQEFNKLSNEVSCVRFPKEIKNVQTKIIKFEEKYQNKHSLRDAYIMQVYLEKKKKEIDPKGTWL